MVYTALTIIEVYLMRDILRSNKIYSEIRNEHFSGLQPSTPLISMQPQLWVVKTNQIKALEIIHDFFQVPDENIDPDELGPCKNCGEQEIATFSHCWNCGDPYPVLLKTIKTNKQ